MLKIDTDVPAPATKSRRARVGSEVISTVQALRVEESVLISPKIMRRDRAINAAALVGRVTGKMFTTRTFQNGVRIWRIE